MAFDAGMVAAVANELRIKLTGARVEKVQQPEKDEIVLVMHSGRENYRLCLSAGVGSARVNLTAVQKENPQSAPMFCMLLRKHLTGSRLQNITQLGFERVLEFEFEGYDEMGFISKRYIIAEIMGKCSNIIFTNEEKKVLGAVKTVDFTTSRLRQVLPGMIYEMPPSQEGKTDPLSMERDEFYSLFEKKGFDAPADKFILNNFIGISPLISREIAYLAGDEISAQSLWNAFSAVCDVIRNADFTPILIKDESGKPFEYSFMPIKQYGISADTEDTGSFGALIDGYFAKREKIERIKQRSSDIMKLLTNAEAHLRRKIAAQENDIKASEEKEVYKRNGDLITANMYMLSRGMTSAELVDYSDENMPTVTVTLDSRLTPAQNAQRYYKYYNKAKAAQIEVAKQLEISKSELEYIYTVFEALVKAENEADLAEIRDELYRSGYASKMKNYAVKKMSASKPLEFVTDGGYRVLCGKNNTQNDYITTKLADKNDYWFHVKNMPGSHVLLICDDEPGEMDFTQAAMIAARYSKASDGVNVAVDYTKARYVKKPGGSKPGFVIYTTNWTAYVTPDAKEVERLKK